MPELPVFEAGKSYRLLFQIDGQKYPRTGVLTFMGDGQYGLAFSGRPLFGTESFRREWILGAEEVPAETPRSVNQRATPEEIQRLLVS